MKRVIIILMFLILATNVLAMNSSIEVKTDFGNEVKLYVWPIESGPILNSAKGIADENGTFETTFFSLNVPSYKLQVMVINSAGEKIRDKKFSGMTILKPIFIDCTSAVCDLSVVEIVEINESIIKNETIVVENDEKIVSKFTGFVLSGKAIFSNKDGSLNLGYSIGGFVFLLCLVVFIFGFFRHGKVKQSEVLDDEEKELQDMEKKVKETAEKIKNVKEKKERRTKIYDAKVKLAEEEKELKELEDGGSKSEVEKQEDVVEKAEDKVDDAKNED